MQPSRTHRLAGFAVFLAGAVLAGPTLAQSVDGSTQRNLDQQQRVENGLQSGQLNTREASQLEQGQARIDRTEQRDMHNGSLSQGEQSQLNRMQNRQSTLIYNDKHDTITGNPQSASSERMQRDVSRDTRQQQRIQAGTASGNLTNHEAGRLEGREAHLDHAESVAGRNGHVGGWEQGHIQRTENRDSQRIFRQKHNGRRG